MNIKVFFETNKNFNNRIKKIQNKFSFSAFIHEIDIRHNDKEFDSNKNKGIRYEDSTCIIKPHDLSGTKHFGIEQFENLAELLYSFGTENILINNPTKTLNNILRRRDDVTFNNNPTFKKISINKIQRLSQGLRKNIIGQDDAINIIIRKLFIQKIRKNSKPIVLMFYGNPGVGKTEVAKEISKLLYGSNDFIREQMSMSGGSTSLEYFKSTSHENDSFSKKLLNRESNILLLDEFAISPSYIQTSFFQLFDEGKFVDQNYSVDMRNSIIICTSNYTSIRDMYNNVSPALLSRYDAFVHFKDFSKEEKLIISKKIMDEYINNQNMDKEYIDVLDYDNVEKKVLNYAYQGNNFRQIRSIIEDIIADDLINNGILKD